MAYFVYTIPIPCEDACTLLDNEAHQSCTKITDSAQHQFPWKQNWKIL